MCGSAADSKFRVGQRNLLKDSERLSVADSCVVQCPCQDYGYSGVAKPANSNANIAMYAVGGAAVGAVAGAGAMYAYNNMILGSNQ